MITTEQNPENLTEAISDFFTGYGRRRPEDLTRLANFGGWSALAQRELESRAFAFITAMPTAELTAIASGAIDVPAIIKNIQKAMPMSRAS